MIKVGIFTNSVSDISPEIAEQYGICLIPDTMIFDDQCYLNNIDINPEMFYKMLKDAKNLPTSSHPNIHQYIENLKTACDCDEILCINITSKMSGSYNTACTVKKILEEEGFLPRIFTYDSLQVSHGLALLVIEAAKLAQKGICADDIISHLNRIRQNIGVYFVMQSLKNAKKGGRVGAIRALAADILGVKPVLRFNDGLVRDVGIVRRFDDGLRAILKYYRNDACRGRETIIFHANNETDAKRLADQIKEIDPDAKIRIEWVGAVIGIYTGEGCVGIAFHGQE